jgi:hypothetical protein
LLGICKDAEKETGGIKRLIQEIGQEMVSFYGSPELTVLHEKSSRSPSILIFFYLKLKIQPVLLSLYAGLLPLLDAGIAWMMGQSIC